MKDCAQREAFEETGIAVEVTKFLYMQTLSLTPVGDTWLEHFWLAKPMGNTDISPEHIDQFGVVDEARWFNRSSIQSITVYPEILKMGFWEDVGRVTETTDRYIGNFKV